MTFHTIRTRPENIPEDWSIYNAPRPIPGEIVWDGDFLHGVFYAAVPPEAERLGFGNPSRAGDSPV